MYFIKCIKFICKFLLLVFYLFFLYAIQLYSIAILKFFIFKIAILLKNNCVLLDKSLSFISLNSVILFNIILLICHIFLFNEQFTLFV